MCVQLEEKMNPGTHILSLDTAGATLDLIGGKGQSLASMTSAGFDVPGGRRGIKKSD